MIRPVLRAAALLAGLLLCACGQKGNLYLPDESRPVVVPATPQASPAVAPAGAATGSQDDDEQRRRAQQPAPADDATGN